MRDGSGPPGRPRLLLGGLGLLLVVTMLMRASLNMAQTTFPLVAGDLLHLDASVVGFMAAGTSVVSLLAMVFVASRVSTGRSYQALVVSMLVLALAFPLIGAAQGIALLVAGGVMLGFGGGLGFPTLITAVGSTAGEDGSKGSRDRPIALLGVGLSISLAVGPFVETGVLDIGHASLRSAFGWFTIAPVAAAALAGAVLIGRRSDQSRSDQSRSGARRLRTFVISKGAASSMLADGPEAGIGPVAADPVRASPFLVEAGELAIGAGGEPVGGKIGRPPQPAPSGRPPQPAPSGRVQFRATLREPAFRVALLGQLVYAAPFTAIVVFGALLARHDYGVSPTGTQVAFGAFFVVSLLVRLAIVRHSPIPRKLALFRAGTLLTLVGIVLLALGHSEAVLLCAMGVLGVPHGLTFPLTLGLVAEDRPQAELASVNAHLSASVQVVNLGLPLLLGVGIDAIGYRTMFLVLAAPVIVAGIFQQLAGRQLAAHQLAAHQLAERPSGAGATVR